MSSCSAGCLLCTVLWWTSLGSASLPRLGREVCYSCTCVPSFARIIAERVYSMSGVCSCFVRSLWCRYSWPRESLLASLFLSIDRIDTPQRVCSGHWNVGFPPSPVHAIGLTHLLGLSPEGCIKWRKKSILGMYLAYFSITIFTW